MSVKHYDIEFPKLDSNIIPFKITEEGKELAPEDEIYMTVAFKPGDEYKFQKSLENGITYNSEEKRYEIEIKTEDTKDLKYKAEYGYDITIYYEGKRPKQKVVGKFIITDKFTINEVKSNE